MELRMIRIVSTFVLIHDADQDGGGGASLADGQWYFETGRHALERDQGIDLIDAYRTRRKTGKVDEQPCATEGNCHRQERVGQGLGGSGSAGGDSGKRLSHAGQVNDDAVVGMNRVRGRDRVRKISGAK